MQLFNGHIFFWVVGFAHSFLEILVDAWLAYYSVGACWICPCSCMAATERKDASPSADSSNVGRASWGGSCVDRSSVVTTGLGTVSNGATSYHKISRSSALLVGYPLFGAL